jgi:hypothetical protein
MKKTLLLITTILLLTSCNEEIELAPATNKTKEVEVVNGSDGASAVLDSVILPVDRENIPWSSNNEILAPYDLIVYLPASFEFPDMTRPDNSGWIDITINDEVFCYQGKFNTRIYEFSYKKTATATTGCDSNSDKFGGKVTMYAKAKKDQVLRIIPRAPRLAGEYFELELLTLGTK